VKIFATLVSLLLLTVSIQAGTTPPPKPEASPSPSAPPSTPPPLVEPRVTNESLIRVNSTNQSYDFFRPWTKKAPYVRRGLGVILPGGQVLVTAELIANHTYVEFEKPNSAEKSPADVLVVDYDCNLALLRPVNKDFLKDSKPLDLDTDGRVGDKVQILQLEPNGEIAQTPGTVTTTTVSSYPLDHLGLLIFRVSAPLQSREGSFTIPALHNGRLLGLLMRYDARSQTAELIPSPVISHFLKDAETAPYTGFPRAGMGFASTRDPQFRRYIGLKEDGGVYVTQVLPGSAAEKAGLKRGDIILSVADKAIDPDGNYVDAAYGKIPFSNLTNTLSHCGDTVKFTILRDGKRQDFSVKLDPVDQSKVTSEPYVMDRQPKFYILGGLVFQELSRPYLQEWGPNWIKEAPQRLVYLDAFQDEEPDHGKIVFLSQVLPSQDTLGYDNLDHLVVKKLNGVEIKSLADLARAAQTPKDGFHKIEFDEDPGVIYLNAEDIEKDKERLIGDYGLPMLQNLK